MELIDVRAEQVFSLRLEERHILRFKTPLCEITEPAVSIRPKHMRVVPWPFDSKMNINIDVVLNLL